MTVRISVLLTYFLISSIYLVAQTEPITASGTIIDQKTKEKLPFVKVVLRQEADSSLVQGVFTDGEGFFKMENIKAGNYFLRISSSGFVDLEQPFYVGTKSEFLSIGVIELVSAVQDIGEVVVVGKQEVVNSKLDKKTFKVEDNISQSGGSALQAMENLPGITIQDNKVQLRGNENVIILIDGKQSALTGMGGQSGLDNIPASSIERIEIISNPSSKFDANGNAGIINIILKKEKKEGFNGKISLTGGLGALWVKRESLPSIRPQYQYTPKVNPSISINYRKKDVNVFLQVDDLYTETLNKNEFVTRTYDDGTIINQQTVRNRNTNFLTSRLGLDWMMSDANQLNISGMFGSEKIIDNGDQPFFNGTTNERIRLWSFLEDELKTTIVGQLSFEHKFKQPGRILNTGLNYTFHREDERYFFDNILPTFTGEDSFKLLSDEHVADFNLDYAQPLKYGKLEIGAKFRYRTIPINMEFYPGLISPLDSNAGGWAVYNEVIPAIYGNYLFDSKKFEGEIGIRAEYVGLNYQVNPDHNTYKSDGYSYIQPFPNVRLGYKVNDNDRISIFFNRRVDRPNEVDIRIFPKYDDAEIIKVGNPSLKPQFTNALELANKLNFKKGYWYLSAYSRFASGTITRISTTVDSSNLIYAIFQNAGKSRSFGMETLLSNDPLKWFSYNLGINVYFNQIDAFTVENLYPTPHSFSMDEQSIITGNAKLNLTFHFKKDFDLQITSIYLAPDIIPQGRIDTRFSLNVGMKKSIQKGKGELFLNASDLLNTMVIKTEIQGNGFNYISSNYYETQVIRLGYSYKF